MLLQCSCVCFLAEKMPGVAAEKAHVAAADIAVF
jgi:hypothetical protein